MTLKLSQDRLKKKYGKSPGGGFGGKYAEVMAEVIAFNSEKVSNAINRLSSEKWSKALKNISTKEKRFVLPDVSDVLPRRSVFAKKSLEKGTIISQTIKDRLNADLRAVLKDFTTETGQASFVRRTGKLAGTINPDLVERFEATIEKTFQSYTKKNPKLGMPTNIHAIAVTETRTTINEIKTLFVEKVIEKNPEVKVKKQWLHNPGLSKEPRPGHAKMHLKTIGIDDKFKVPRFFKERGKWVQYGNTPMDRPHDPTAPLDQIITCNCDIQYLVSK